MCRRESRVRFRLCLLGCAFLPLLYVLRAFAAYVALMRLIASVL